MTGPLSRRALRTVVLVTPVLGCAAKPPEKPIVLRPHHPERRLAHRPLPAKPAYTDVIAGPLSPSEKEALFRDFDAYLSRTGKSQ